MTHFLTAGTPPHVSVACATVDTQRTLPIHKNSVTADPNAVTCPGCIEVLAKVVEMRWMVHGTDGPTYLDDVCQTWCGLRLPSDSPLVNSIAKKVTCPDCWRQAPERGS